MILALKGTNGAGKSELVRRVMAAYDLDRKPIHVEGRQKPIGYQCWKRGSKRPLFVVGHYEIPNGGVDTLPDLDYAYALIAEKAITHDVIYEGKNLSDGVDRICLFPADDIRIVVVDHPVTLCVDAVRQRGHSIKTDTIVKVARKVAADAKTLQARGYLVVTLDRQGALEHCLGVLLGRREWIGVDFDHTLRRDDGSPIESMVAIVRDMLAAGKEVRVVTARVSPIDHDPHDVERNREMIELWCERHLGRRLAVQWGKSSGMTELWDDKAVHVHADVGYCPVSDAVSRREHYRDDADCEDPR